MFTGIVQGLADVMAIENLGAERRFRFSPLFQHSSWQDGESIAINGVCLSVEHHQDNCFIAYASEETLAHTTLKKLNVGSRVNIERALSFGERLGGHLVSGHVDCVATVAEVSQKGKSRFVRVTFPDRFSSQVIERGSVALDGISLTVTSCGTGFLTVNLIPDSQKRTNASTWQKGVALNMETDIIGKYVAAYLGHYESGKFPLRVDAGNSGISMDFLGRNGFL